MTPFLLAAGLALAASCGDEPTPEQHAAADLARERAAAWFQKPADDSGLENARKELAALVAGEDALVEDLVRAAAVEFALIEPEAAEAFIDRALAQSPRDIAANFIAGQLAYEKGEVEAAIAHFETTLAGAPGDLPTKLRLASAYEDLEREAEAEALYREIVDLGIENAGDWYIAAVYRLSQLYFMTGQDERAQELVAIRRELDDAGFEAPSPKVILRGTFGVLTPPERTGTVVGPRVAGQHSESQMIDSKHMVGAPRRLALHDLDGDGTNELCLATDTGLWVVEGRLGSADVRSLVQGEFDVVRALDIDNDGDLDLLTFEGATPRFWIQGEGEFEEQVIPCPQLPSRPSDVTVVDFDHEGDVDLLLVGEFGARLWRNDGAWVDDGAFTDATELATLPTDRAFSWCLTEDFDTDQDVDFLLGGEGGAFLADSLRAGLFADETGRLPSQLPTSAKPAVGDVDGDARPDLVTPGAPCRLWRQQADHTYRGEDLAISDDGPLQLADLDGDNAFDLMGSARLALGFALQNTQPREYHLNSLKGRKAGKEIGGVQVRPAIAESGWLPRKAIGFVEDKRHPKNQRLVHWTACAAGVDGSVQFWSSAYASVAAKGRVLNLVGTRDNRRAIGATVEIRCGQSYRRIYWRGEPQLIAAAGYEKIDVLRITWANGVVQPYVDVPFVPEEGADEIFTIEQNAALVGSCPFLYSWNGETFEFISDVLGATPLGLPIAPGVFVAPDHDEYVLVRGEQLVPNDDGKLVLQFTEELREVTYLDRVKLVAVDHPTGSEVFPNELFCFPPFPAHHLHSVEASHAPLRATGSDGKDWTAEVAVTDDRHAVPFEKLPHQFSGLAQPWFLELEFDPKLARDAKQLRLIMTGWFDWSDASANMAAARTPGVDFIPPIFQVPDGEGGWRDVGPPYGFPAGKTKTMVVDVAPWIDRADPRVRVFCSLQLYWDRISLATCADDAQRVRTELEPESADLWMRGFSDPIPTAAADLPERFEWDRIAHNPRWNQHPGMYTKLGDVLPLLGEVDDRFAILGAGDCMTLSFDATALPELPDGWRRDYLVYLDGWAKDRDHNAIGVLEVEPLPFHAMSGYPYGADEHFPKGKLHEQWRAEWNTRPSLQWIGPISVKRVAERIEQL